MRTETSSKSIRGADARREILRHCLLVPGVLLMVLPTLASSGVASSDMFRTNCLGGSIGWDLNGLVINSEPGQICQETHLWYQGDTGCHCTHKNWLGLCDYYEGHGEWIVVWFNEGWQGPNSWTFTPAGAGQGWKVDAYHNGWDPTNGAGCDAAFQGAYAAAKTNADVASRGFHDIEVAGVPAWSRVGVGVPLTQLSVTVPLSEICTNGNLRFHGSLTHADFVLDGYDARYCGAGLNLPLSGLDMNGKASSNA